MRRPPAALLLVGIILGAAVAWVAYSGRVFFVTHQVALPPATAGQEAGGAVYYTAGFDDGYLNDSPSEAKMGTAQATLALERTPGDGYNVTFQLWHAYRTRVSDLRLTLRAPLGNGLWYELPGGNGWGPLFHTLDAEGTTVDLPTLGWGNGGYDGTIWLRFASVPGGVRNLEGAPLGDLQADVEFDMYPATFPRFSQWHVQGSFEVPASALVSP